MNEKEKGIGEIRGDRVESHTCRRCVLRGSLICYSDRDIDEETAPPRSEREQRKPGGKAQILSSLSLPS